MERKGKKENKTKFKRIAQGYEGPLAQAQNAATVYYRCI